MKNFLKINIRIKGEETEQGTLLCNQSKLDTHAVVSKPTDSG